MPMVNMLQAKTNLSRLVAAVETGRETEVIVARDGKPAARLVAVSDRKPIRLGLAEGNFSFPDDDPEMDAEIRRMFEESRIFPGEDV